MINLDQIEGLTQAYLCSYNTALKEVRNPELAVQAATSIIMGILMVEQSRQPKIDPLRMFTAILQQAAQKNREEESDHDRAEDAEN